MNDLIDKIIFKLEEYKNSNIKIYSSELKSYKEYINSEFKNDLPDFKDLIIEDTDENSIKETVKEYMNKDKWKSAESLDQLYDMICDCKKCDLWKTRTNFVFGSGNKNADLVIIGEAPGADEDKQGLPFVGRAGKLLTQILEAINFKREEVYICNVLKSRPPENRNPTPEEIKQCEPYLEKQLELIKPKMLLCLGTFAAQTLLKSKEALGKLRGKFHTYKNIPLLVTYHPAALLRNPNWKKPTWEDVQLLRKEFDKLAVK
ncbi:MAG TPA: uracil-DNA glycosylase [Bacteroidetes bacterium]|nr:uracil-DNA glycosylase [Bacteroidota bacterium]